MNKAHIFIVVILLLLIISSSNTPMPVAGNILHSQLLAAYITIRLLIVNPDWTVSCTPIDANYSDCRIIDSRGITFDCTSFIDTDGKAKGACWSKDE